MATTVTASCPNSSMNPGNSSQKALQVLASRQRVSEEARMKSVQTAERDSTLEFPSMIAVSPTPNYWSCLFMGVSPDALTGLGTKVCAQLHGMSPRWLHNRLW